MIGSKNFSFFQQNKNITNKHYTRNQLPYSEGYFSQNQQRFTTNQQNKNWDTYKPDYIHQPDPFEPST